MSRWNSTSFNLLLAFLTFFLVGVIEFMIASYPSFLDLLSVFVPTALIVGVIYGLLGVTGFLVISLLIFVVRIRGYGKHLSLFLLWCLLTFVYTGYLVNKELLSGIPVTHPVSLAASLVLLIVCLALFYFLFKRTGGETGSTESTSAEGVLKCLSFLVFLHLVLPLGVALPDDPLTTGGKHSNPNLLLITADTLRRDHLGCYGREGIRTPVIDSLAAKGVLFENALTSISLTLPSHISIMTGLYPPTHGIRFNGDFTLSDTLTTLAEILHDQGYSTGAFVGSYALDAGCGLAQGFSAYDAGHLTANPVKKMVHPKLSKPFSRLLLMRALMYILPVDLLFTSEYQRPAELVNKPALNWLENHGQEPFFLWLHYFDAHTPYRAPDVPGLDHPGTSIPNPDLITRGPPYEYWWGVINSEEELYRKYDGDIEYLDYWLGQIMNDLKERGVLDRTLIVFTSDHGECLWEHGMAGHGSSVWEAELRVPLILTHPGSLPAGTRVSGLVESIDILPTILELLGVPEYGPVQGRSLVGLIKGSKPGDTRQAYIETVWPREPGKRRRGIRTDEWKYFTDFEGGPGHLFHLPSDPNELHDLSGERPEIARSMNEQLEKLCGEVGSTDVPFPAMNEETENRLRALGYVR